MSETGETALASPSLLRLFGVMFRIGAFTFGGGYAMVAQIERDLTVKNRWANPEDVTDILAVSSSLPGVLAVNTAVLVGYRLRKLPGALVAALGAVLPSFLILVLVSLGYEVFIDNPIVAGAMRGIRACVCGLLAYSVFTMTVRLKTPLSYIICAAAFLLGFFWVDNPIWLILAAVCLGLGRFLVAKHRAAKEERHE